MKRTVSNTTRYRSSDIFEMVRGALRASKATAASCNIAVRYSRTGEPQAEAKVSYIAGPKSPVTRERKREARWTIKLAILADMDLASKHALAGKLMAAIGKQRFPLKQFIDWQQPTNWCDDLPLGQHQKATMTPAERASEREAHARKMLARAEADRDRAQARVDKWAVKVKYYDRKQETQA